MVFGLGFSWYLWARFHLLCALVLSIFLPFWNSSSWFLGSIWFSGWIFVASVGWALSSLRFGAVYFFLPFRNSSSRFLGSVWFSGWISWCLWAGLRLLCALVLSIFFCLSGIPFLLVFG